MMMLACSGRRNTAKYLVYLAFTGVKDFDLYDYFLRKYPLYTSQIISNTIKH
jgi:hypothetical protein